MDNINNFIKNLEALAVEVAKPNYIAGSIFTGLKVAAVDRLQNATDEALAQLVLKAEADGKWNTADGKLILDEVKRREANHG